MSSLLSTILEILEEASQTPNSGKTQQYNTTNKNPNRYVSRNANGPSQRPVQSRSYTSSRGAYNAGAGGRQDSAGRPGVGGGLSPEGRSSLEGRSLFEEGHGSMNFQSTEGTSGLEGSNGLEGNSDASKINRPAEIPSPQSRADSTSALDFSEITGNDLVRGIIFSEILSKPKALRRGRW